MNRSKGNGRRPPGEGERAARRGYRHQDRASARLIYEALVARRLRWIGLADRHAGDVDDLVLGLIGEIVAHQFKRSLHPTGFGLEGLLLGAGGEIANLAAARAQLLKGHPGTPVRIRYFTNDYPSTNDRLIPGDARSTTAEFVAEWARDRHRSLSDWRATRWSPVVDALAAGSGITDTDFETFWLNFELVSGESASLAFAAGVDAEREQQIEDLSRAVGSLVADNPAKDRWTRDELLAQVGWPDRFALRFEHDFPVGAWVQRNAVTEARLARAVAEHIQGYLGLIGPPGAGKSTLLARELREGAALHIVRYLAFVPGLAQGQGRGESDSFYHDVITQLASDGLEVARLRDDTTHARRAHFEKMLAKAGERFASDNVRTVIVVDGLDHVPREETTAQSLLTALPLPQSVPKGVVFVLGTQRLELPGMPPAVVEQAGSAGRRIDVDPLGEVAVEAMADAAGLNPEIDRADLFRVGGGHPLVTRYLIERLLTANLIERKATLDGDFGHGGDLEAVYRAAWRWIERSENPAAVKEVLALVAHAQGPIEPEVLATATGEEAVETALSVAGHLLLVTPSGWSVFHNSFRLFVQRQSVLRFGKPHPEFTPQAIYRRLGDLVGSATASSPQRWLSFRYAYLAGDHDAALEIGSRRHFVAQYVEGRNGSAVVGDIGDYYRLLRQRPDAAKLFEMMLAQDEVERRVSVMESATGLVDANVALGDLDAALDALKDIDEDGQQWTVMDALLAAGRIDDARRLFEASDPFQGIDGHHRIGVIGEFEHRMETWSRRAVLFLDADQIEREIAQVLDLADAGLRDELLKLAGSAVALALIARDPSVDFDGLCTRWSVPAVDRARVAIEGAQAAFDAGDEDRAAELLGIVADRAHLESLHASWPIAAAGVAARLGSFDLAGRLLAAAPLRGLGNMSSFQSDAIDVYCTTLVNGIIVRVAANIPFDALGAPDASLLLGIQRHLVMIATAIGDVQAGRAVPASTVVRLASSALTYLAHARHPDEYDNSYFRLPVLGRTVADMLYELAAVARVPGEMVAERVDAKIVEGASFRHWRGFRRHVAIRAFDLDRNPAAAAKRLEAALEDLECSDPREEVDEVARFATDFATIGQTDRARSLLAGLRASAFGVYLPAKKDGQYEMWTDLLALANAADPAGRRHRARTLLHLVEGLEQTEGYGMGRRMVLQVLHEAVSADVATAGQALAWAMERGRAPWDGIVDAILRGMIVRSPRVCRDALTAWCWLCLPWYGELRGKTNRSGSFLTEVVAACALEDLVAVEAETVAAISMLSPADARLRLLRVLETAFAERGGGAAVREAVAVVAAAETGLGEDDGSGADPRNRSYERLSDLAQVTQALEEELAYQFRAREDGRVEVSVEPGWNIRPAAARVVASSPWPQVADFANRQPELIAEPDIALAAAKVALAAGEVSAAEELIAGSKDRDRTREGWNWPSDKGTLRRHEARHLLKFADAFEAARRDLFDDLAARRYAISGLVWATDRIFPVAFPDVSWPRLWEMLEEQLLTMRDFARGRFLDEEPAGPVPPDDDALLATLFAAAFGTGVMVLADCALRAARVLLARERFDFFAHLVDALLARDDGALFAAHLLTCAADEPAARERFRSRLTELAHHADFALVLASLFLSARWCEPLAVKAGALPAFYDLHLPKTSGPDRTGAIDERTGGMVLEDPLGWTQKWMREVESIALAGGVSVDQVRRRAAQFIGESGGIARFGHSGSKDRESRLTRLGLKLPFMRPPTMGALQALRRVAAELVHAGRVNGDEMHRLARTLRINADQPSIPWPEARPADITLTKFPHMYRNEERDTWLALVRDDLVQSPTGVLAETCMMTSRSTRVELLRERYAAASLAGVDALGLDDTLSALPQIEWRNGFGVRYGKEEAHSSRIALFHILRIERLPLTLMVFCPYAATSLGWSLEAGSVHRYIDADGRRMAWTAWWRDGLRQPVDEDELSGEGQRVHLSAEGLVAFETMFGALQLSNAAWRKTAENNSPVSARFASSETTSF